MSKVVNATNAAPLDFAKMPDETLQAAAFQLQREVELLMNSIPPLNDALTRFKKSVQATKELSEMKVGQSMLVPVSDSAYCEGEMGDTKEVYVDIGSDYIVGVTAPEAIAILDRRQDKLAAELKAIEETLLVRRQSLEIANNEINRRAKQQQ